MTSAELFATADRIASHLAERSIAASLVFLLVLAVAVLARRRASSHFRAALPLLVLVPLVVPVDGFLASTSAIRELRASLRTWAGSNDSPDSSLPAPAAEPTAIDRASRPSAEALDLDAPLHLEASAEVARRTPPDVAEPLVDRTANREPALRTGGTARIVALALWAAAVLFLLGKLAFAQRGAARAVARATRVDDAALRSAWPRLALRAGLRAVPALRESDEFPSPVTFGLFEPVVVIPRSLRRELRPAQLEFVLLHELAHVRRRDLWIALVQQVVQIVYFFHPLVWMANRSAAEERECACDDAALSGVAPEDREECARAFLHVVERAQRGSIPRTGIAALFDHRALLRRRLMNLADGRRRTARHMSWPAAATVAMTAGVALCAASTLRAEPPVRSTRTDPGAAIAPDPKTAAATPSPADREVDDAIERTVDWFLARQGDEGLWSRTTVDDRVPVRARTEDRVDPFDPGRPIRVEPTKPTPSHAPTELERVGSTALALLVLMESRRQGEANVATAIDHGFEALLRLQLPDDGMVGERQQHGFVYGHLVATQALLKGLRRGREELRVPSQRALDFLLRARNPYQGWRYDYPPTGDNDSSITSLALLCLASGRSLGLRIDDAALEGGLGFLDEVTDERSGRTGYLQRGSFVVREREEASIFPPERSEALTAIALCTRFALQSSGDRERWVDLGSNLLAGRPPKWDEEHGDIDFYYWFFGTTAMRQVGGAKWEQWKEHLAEALLPHQVREGEDCGAWPPASAWSRVGGKEFGNALCALALAGTRAPESKN